MKKTVPNELSKTYLLPRQMSDFQMSIYPHLIEWKRKHITAEPGSYHGNIYDAILPRKEAEEFAHIYKSVAEEISRNHRFKKHPHFGHMASSQAACINLFAPLLVDTDIANQVLPKIKRDYSRLATDQLDGGFRFEYWDETNTMHDHTTTAGTDSDVAIAYYDTHEDLCLWLIEHKLAEDEFTTCGGYRSRGNQKKEQCMNGSAVLADSNNCYYQHARKYRYWQIFDTGELYDLSALRSKKICPFRGGENQLWRNQIMGEAVRRKGDYKKVHLSVVHHPDNPDLADTIESYRALLKDESVFSVLTSAEVVNAAESVANEALTRWAGWYRELYRIGCRL